MDMLEQKATPQGLRRAVFLDRDGTLNEDLGYVYRKEDWRWLPGVVETLKRLRAADYMLVVVSNQSGLARGMYGRDDLRTLEEWITADLAKRGAHIDAWRYCPHLPEITGPCACRKPQPGLLLDAARDLHIDLAQSWMIGDQMRDVQAGMAAGCRCILLRRAGTSELPAQVTTLPHLAAAGLHILAPTYRTAKLTWLKRHTHDGAPS